MCYSLVSENISILIGVEGQFKDAVHNTAFDSHLGILQLVLACILPNGITGHGAVQVAQKILHCCRLVIGCCAPLERWRGEGDLSLASSINDISICNRLAALEFVDRLQALQILGKKLKYSTNNNVKVFSNVTLAGISNVED